MTMFERFSRSARVAVVLAQEEARDLGARAIGPEHLLISVLQGASGELSSVVDGYGLTAEVVRGRLAESVSGGDDLVDDAEALQSIGIDLDAVRDAVLRTFGADAFDGAFHRSGRRRRRRGHLPFDRSAKKVLELALREALAHKDKEISAEHVLLGILRGRDRRTIALINEHVYTAQLRASLLAVLDQAA
jgi:ATP-dependent Clp protease ATP-binding subunit ClpA